MNKKEIRRLKTHYGARWVIMRHNQKNSNKILLVIDNFVLKNLIKGSTLCYNCLGNVYNDIIPQLHTEHDDITYNNLVLINNIEFKYKTIDEISDNVSFLSKKFLKPGGRLIFSIDHRFLIYNRVEQSVNSMLDSFVTSLPTFQKITAVNLLGKTPYGYGSYFFCFKYK
jgi:hypothetical protein